MTYSYKMIREGDLRERTAEGWDEALRRAGAEGWRLVQVVVNTSNMHTAILEKAFDSEGSE